MLNPADSAIIDFSELPQPLLLVVVDTEAGFNWAQSSSRRTLGVHSVKAQLLAEQIYPRFDLKPTYVVDYPVASQPEGFETIRALHEAGRCEVGTHLQPWDTPPLTE